MDVPTQPKNNSDELGKLGTFPPHLWELIISYIPLDCVCNIGLVCKPFYFSSLNNSFTPDDLFGHWAFLFAVGSIYRTTGDLQLKDGLVHSRGVTPLGSTACEYAAIGLRKGNTIALNKYYSPQWGEKTRNRFSVMLMEMKYIRKLGGLVATGTFATQARIQNFDTSPIIGMKALKTLHTDPLIELKNNKDKKSVEIYLLHLPSKVSIIQQTREKLFRVFPNENMHAQNPELLPLLTQNWTFTFVFVKDKLEFDAEPKENIDENLTVRGTLGNLRVNGTQHHCTGEFVMCLNRTGMVGLSLSYNFGKPINTILSALGELSKARDSMSGECVVLEDETKQTGSFVGVATSTAILLPRSIQFLYANGLTK